jgi:hypothetical protein
MMAQVVGIRACVDVDVSEWIAAQQTLWSLARTTDRAAAHQALTMI